MLAPTNWAPNKVGVGVTQGEGSHLIYVLQRLSIMALMCLLSWTTKCFSALRFIKLLSKPNLHSSLSGTCLTGKAALTLKAEYSSTNSSCVTCLRYLRFLQVVDLGSLETILARILTSLLGEFRSFLKKDGYLPSI